MFAAVVPLSCMKEVDDVPSGGRVRVVLSVMDNYPTKGALLSSGPGVWGPSENRINTWAVGLYSSGTLCYCDFGGAGSPPPLIPLPEDGDLKVYAVVNAGGFEFPHSFDECLEHVFEFNPEELKDGGSPASGWAVVEPGSENVSISLERMVAKIVFTLDKEAYPSLTVTEISLHDVALDSDSGSVAGYMSGGFDTATGSELAGINAGNRGEIVFICPENLKGTVPGITSPYYKTPPSAPAHSTYLEVRGTVPGNDYGSGEMVYRFYLGADDKNDFNIARNRVYHVTLVLNESMMEVYRGGGYWKVDTGGFEYENVRFVWLKDGIPSNTATVREGETACLMIHLPGYMDKANTLVGVMVGDESCGYEGWTQESYQECRDLLDNGLDYQSDDFGLDFMAPVQSRELAIRNIATLADGEPTPSSSWSYHDRHFPGATVVRGAEGCQEMLFCISRVGRGPGMPVPENYAGWYMMEIGNSVDYEGTPVAVYVYYGLNEELYAFPVFHEATVSPHLDMGTRAPDDLYIGEKVPVSVEDCTMTPAWTVVSGGDFISLSASTGPSTSIICKRAGQARIRCDAKPGNPVFMDVRVKTPELFSWYGWWHGTHLYRSAQAHGEDAENILVENGAYDLGFDGSPNMNIGWWYMDDSGQRIEYSDASCFNSYVGASLTFDTDIRASLGFDSEAVGYSAGLYLSDYGTSPGQYVLVQGNDGSNNRERLGTASFHDALGNAERWPVYTLFRLPATLRMGNYAFMEGAVPSSETAKAEAETVDLAHGPMEGCRVWNLDSHFELSDGKLGIKPSVLSSNPCFKGTYNADFGVCNIHSGKIFGKTGRIDVYLNLGVVLKTKMTMIYVGIDSGHKPSVGLAPCWYNPQGTTNPPDVPSDKGLFAWSSTDLKGSETAGWFHKRTWTKYSVQTHADPESPEGIILYPYVENTMVVPDTFTRRPWTFAIPTHVLIDPRSGISVVSERYPNISFLNGNAALGNIAFVERTPPIGYLRKGGDSNGLYPESVVIEDGRYILHNMTDRLEYNPVFQSR